MICSAVGAAASAWLLGFLCVGALWPRERFLRADRWLVLSLGLGAGLGATSACFFAAALISDSPGHISAALELGLGAAAGWRLWRRRRDPAGRPEPRAGHDARITAILASVFAQACVISLVVATRAYQAEPYSNSDGWTIWNLHARVLFRGGPEWPLLLQRGQLAWTHPDYPLLVPASVARAWTYAGQDAPFGSGLVSSLFGVATVGLLVSAAARLRHAHVALVGGLVLVGTPFFVTFSSNQHADIPLGFYVLATLVLVTVGRHPPAGGGLWALAGAMAGMAAWTKNEGWLFVVAVGSTCVAAELVRGSRRAAGAFVAGLSVALLPVLYFKTALAPPNDILASHPLGHWQLVLEWPRHRLILASMARDIWRFGEWSIVPFAAMVLPLLGPGWKRLSRREWRVAWVLGLMLVGYYGVYLLTHWDLASHVDSSLVRLLLQLWPAAVFFWCLAATYDAPIRGTTSPPHGTRRWSTTAAILLANVVVAAGVLTVLNGQPAANELAAGRRGGARVQVLLGEGWFGREGLGRDVWAWSKGESTLLLRTSGSEGRSVRLVFTIRGLGTRTVTASTAGNVVWHGAVREEAESVEIAGLNLSAGTTPLVFRTDAPGVPESDAPGARALTYALYNPVIDDIPR